MMRGQLEGCLVQWASKRPKGPIAIRATRCFVGRIGFDTQYKGRVCSMQQRIGSSVYERTVLCVSRLGSCLHRRYKLVKCLPRRANDLR